MQSRPHRIPTTLAFTLTLLFFAHSAASFMAEGCSSKPCSECHKLEKEEAETLLAGLVDEVQGIHMARVPGLFALDLKRQDRVIPVYLDFSKRYLITGDVVDLTTRQSLTKDRFIDLNRVDVDTIPLDDAVVIGNPNAATKVILFDDPECPFCKKIHPEMKAVAAQRPDIAFFVKMLPLKIHPNARKKAEAIICAKSAEMLEDSLAGKELPEPSCETDQIEKNEQLAVQLGIRSTPTLVLPDGRVIPGYKEAQQIIHLIEGK